MFGAGLLRQVFILANLRDDELALLADRLGRHALAQDMIPFHKAILAFSSDPIGKARLSSTFLRTDACAFCNGSPQGRSVITSRQALQAIIGRAISNESSPWLCFADPDIAESPPISA